jgi:hypothetical protein
MTHLPLFNSHKPVRLHLSNYDLRLLDIQQAHQRHCGHGFFRIILVIDSHAFIKTDILNKVDRRKDR